MKHLLLGCFVLVAISGWTQIKIEGHVLDHRSGEALEGALVQVNGTVLTSGSHGDFSVEIPKGGVNISCSFIGYESFTDTLYLERSIHYDIQMLPRIALLQTAKVQSDAVRSESILIQPVELDNIAARRAQVVGQDISSLLATTPGVNVLSTGANAGQVSIRGVHGSRVGLLVDGIPLQNQQWGDDHGADIDPWLAERVEVYRSAANTRFGPNASGGAIALLPVAMLDTNTWRFQAFAQGQSVVGGLNGGIRFRKRWDKFEVDASLLGRRYADLRIPADTFEYLTRNLPLMDRRMVNTSGRGDAQRVRLRYQGERGGWRAELRRNARSYGIFPGIFGIPSLSSLEGDNAPYQTVLPEMQSEHLTASFVGHRNLSESTIRYRFGYQVSNRKELGPPHGHGNAPLPEDSTALDLTLDALFADLSMVQRLENGLEWTYGVQWERIDSRSAGWEFLVSNYQSDLGGIYTSLGGWRTALGVFSGSVRMDGYQLRTDGYLEPIYNLDEQVVDYWQRSPRTNRFFTGLSASLLWKSYESSHRRWSAQLHRAIRFPNGYEIAANGVHHGTFRHEQGNPDLNPEVSYGAELNFGYTYDNLVLSISPFTNYYTNYVYLTPSASFSPLPEAGQLYRFEQNRAFRSGAEVDFRWMIHPRWELKGDLAGVFGWNVDKRTGLPWTPPVQARTWIAFYPGGATRPTTVSFGTTGVAAQTNTATNESNTPGYVLLNAAASGELGPINWSVNVQNILNTPYLNHMSRYRLIDLPDPGRNIGITLKYQFENQ